MIPKKIHYCWFGGKDIPEKDKKCIESWKKFCPDYEIIEWNELNYDLTKNPYMYEAYKNKKWGFVPDYARFDIIYSQGGIYMDTDVEVIRPLDEMLECKGYMGFEEGNFVNGGIGFGAEAGNPIIKALRDMYDDVSFILPDGSLNLLPSPYYITDALERFGLKRNNEKQILGDGELSVFPKDYFSPKDFSTDIIALTDNTFTIHHYNASWLSVKEIKRHRTDQKINRIFGKKLGNVINNIRHKFINLFKRIKKVFCRKK